MRKILLIVISVFFIIFAFIGFNNDMKNFTGPMGYEFRYIRTINENEIEYRDSQTGIHYIVDSNKTIKSPIFKNTNYDLLITK